MGGPEIGGTTMKALLVLATVLTASAIAATAALASGSSQYGQLDPWLKAAMSGQRAAADGNSWFGQLDPWLKAAMSAHRAVPQGYTIITDTLGGNGSPKTTPDLFERSVAIHEWHEARAQARAVLAQQARSTTLITDTLGGNGGTSLAARRYDPQAYVNSSFSWTDAGVGAATAAGSMLVLVGSGLLLLRRRSGLAV